MNGVLALYHFRYSFFSLCCLYNHEEMTTAHCVRHLHQVIALCYVTAKVVLLTFYKHLKE